MADRDHILDLSAGLAAHDDVTHRAIGLRPVRKGDFIHGLMNGGDCRTRTARV